MLPPRILGFNHTHMHTHTHTHAHISQIQLFRLPNYNNETELGHTFYFVLWRTNPRDTPSLPLSSSPTPSLRPEDFRNPPQLPPFPEFLIEELEFRSLPSPVRTVASLPLLFTLRPQRRWHQQVYVFKGVTLRLSFSTGAASPGDSLSSNRGSDSDRQEPCLPLCSAVSL